jgi:hypothetical protein
VEVVDWEMKKNTRKMKAITHMRMHLQHSVGSASTMPLPLGSSTLAIAPD